MNVLVIAPHPDDEAIGCGGTIRLHIDQGDRVGVVFLTSGELGIKSIAAADVIAIREAEARAASVLLGHEILSFLKLPDYDLLAESARAARLLEPIVRDWQPSQIYIPHPQESHPDHAACHEILRAALRALPTLSPWILGYEVWTPMREYDNVQDITSVWAAKLASIHAYPSQLANFAYDTAAQGLNNFRGALAGRCAFAEVQVSLD